MNIQDQRPVTGWFYNGVGLKDNNYLKDNIKITAKGQRREVFFAPLSLCGERRVFYFRPGTVTALFLPRGSIQNY